MGNQEIADILGVHAKYVPTLRKKPGFPGAGTLADVAKWYEEYRQQIDSGQTGGTVERLRHEQAELIATKRAREELKLQQDRGSLVKESAAREAIAAVLRPLRLKLDALPARKAPEVNPSDPPHAERVLREALEEIYAELQAEGQGDAPVG